MSCQALEVAEQRPGGWEGGSHGGSDRRWADDTRKAFTASFVLSTLGAFLSWENVNHFWLRAAAGPPTLAPYPHPLPMAHPCVTSFSCPNTHQLSLARWRPLCTLIYPVHGNSLTDDFAWGLRSI